ncbi:MAG: magnesium transporter CorA family protein [bacterium]|nr:magnesium transporter CorA family protein [bacterium]
MISVCKTENNYLRELTLDTLEKGAWIQLSNPTNEELERVCSLCGVPHDFMMSALDDEERSRLEFDDNSLLVVANTPLQLSDNNFDTRPLGIIITIDYFITVCREQCDVFQAFGSEKASSFDTAKKTRFLFQVLYRIADLYLRRMKEINKLSDRIERALRQSMKNKMLFQLFELERSLVYFTTALKDNGIVLKKLLRMRKNPIYQHLLCVFEEDEDILEDAIVENEQAGEMVDMHRDVLTGMMDAFASVISNNLNIVMRNLTVITIILAIPTMVASFWGMNVPVPWADNMFGFCFIIVIALLLTVGASFITG